MCINNDLLYIFSCYKETFVGYFILLKIRKETYQFKLRAENTLTIFYFKGKKLYIWNNCFGREFQNAVMTNI